MTASTVQANIRQVLADALAGVTANVYSFVPETIIPPATVIVPDSPYFELETIGNSQVRFKINMTVTACVAYSSNPASLDNLEQLVISILSAIPRGYELSVVERPSVTQVGNTNLLCSDIRVSTYYAQTN
jgi:hypothetical protein